MPLLNSKDAKLKRQASSCLGAIAKHNVPLAELVVEGGAFPGLLDKLKDDDLSVRKNSVVLIREIVKHTQELAAVVVGAGGSAAIVDYVSESTGSARFPGIMALGAKACALFLWLLGSNFPFRLHRRFQRGHGTDDNRRKGHPASASIIVRRPRRCCTGACLCA